MKTRIVVTVIVLFVVATFSLQSAKTGVTEPQLTQAEALAFVRALNTAQVDTLLSSGAYASLEGLAKHRFLQDRQAQIALKDSALGSYADYKLSVVASKDGKHYLLGLVPQSGCGTAFLSGESGIIYTGKALGCPAF